MKSVTSRAVSAQYSGASCRWTNSFQRNHPLPSSGNDGQTVQSLSCSSQTETRFANDSLVQSWSSSQIETALAGMPFSTGLSDDDCFSMVPASSVKCGGTDAMRNSRLCYCKAPVPAPRPTMQYLLQTIATGGIYAGLTTNTESDVAYCVGQVSLSATLVVEILTPCAPLTPDAPSSNKNAMLRNAPASFLESAPTL